MTFFIKQNPLDVTKNQNMAISRINITVIGSYSIGFVHHCERQHSDAAKLVKALATNTSLGIVPTEDDVATMLAMLRPGRDGLVHRRPSLAALQQALAAAAGPRRPDSFGGTPSSAPGSPTTGASRSSSEAAPVVRVMR